MSVGRILSDILELTQAKNKALQETIERQQTIIAGLTRDRDELLKRLREPQKPKSKPKHKTLATTDEFIAALIKELKNDIGTND